jgi:integrase
MNASIESVGLVDIYAPTATCGYFRLKWSEPDGTRGDTTGGRYLDFARAKASGINDRIALCAGPLAVTSLEQMKQEYLAHGCSPFGEQSPWKPSQLSQVTRNLTRCLRGYGQHRAMDVDRPLCDLMRSQAGTPAMVRINTSVLRGFLLWGYQAGYLTPLQAELLPEGCAMPRPTLTRTRTRLSSEAVNSRARLNGDHPDYVGEEDAPSRQDVAALSRTLGAMFPAWGALAPELAAATGARWGELFQLTVHDVHLTGCAADANPHLHIDWQVEDNAPKDAELSRRPRRVRPKNDTVRRVPVPTRTITGYPLRQELAARCETALAHGAAAENAEVLLFPAPRGGMFWYAGFNADYLLPAMEAAGWPVERWREDYPVWDENTGTYRHATSIHRHALRPWHSLRHRFARTCIDVYRLEKGELMAIGGWTHIATVENRYYRTGEENMTAALSRFS